MTANLRRLLSGLFALCLLLCLIPVQSAGAEGANEEAPIQAEDVSDFSLLVDSVGFEHRDTLFDRRVYSGYSTYTDASSLTLEYAEGMGSLYLIFGDAYGSYTITDNTSGESITCGKDGFIHEFVDLEGAFGFAPTSITMEFANGRVKICEISVYTTGEVPDSVQKWDHPVDDRTDLILFSTHGDDEQLFFAGLLPYYAVERGYQVQVVYLTDHTNKTGVRIHEMLNGLWAVGIRSYPIFGEYPDFYTKNGGEAQELFAYYGYTFDEMTGWLVEQLRRFKPQVIVGHDFNGEYGHGQHKVYAKLIAAAVEVSNDPSQYPESAEAYGVWDVPKTYIHLYKENQIIMDWDQPMEKYDGMTPFEVSKNLGFYGCHLSQISNFSWWIRDYDTAASVEVWNPSYYGLYRSTVGLDEKKNDFFENLTTYTEQDRIAVEEARRLEEERKQEEARLAAEEEARRQAEEAERLAAEEAQRQEEARLKAEQEAALAREAARRQNLIIFLCAGSAVLVVLIVLILIIAFKKPKR